MKTKSYSKVFPVYDMKVYSGSRGISPLIFNLSTRYRRMVQVHALAALFLAMNPGTHGKGGRMGPQTWS